MTERQVAAYLRLLQRYPSGPPKATYDRYRWQTRFEAIYRLCHGGKPRPSTDGVPPG